MRIDDMKAQENSHASKPRKHSLNSYTVKEKGQKDDYYIV